jgi:hypothetical protein
MILRQLLNSLRSCQSARRKPGRTECTERCLDEMACTAGSEPTVPQRQLQHTNESAGEICRAGWVWVREYVHDLREDYANRVGAP